MISLRKHILEADDRHRLCSDLESSYVAAVSTIGESLVPVSETLTAHHRQQLRQLASELKEGITIDSLQSARTRLEQELATYAEKSCRLLGHQEKEVKKILLCLSQVASVVAAQGQSNSSRLGEFTKNLETISQMSDLPEIRKRLAREIVELRQVAVQVSKGSEEAVEKLREELRTFRSKLDETEQLANTDPLTKVANRRAGEQRIQDLITSNRQFSLLIFDMDRFKGVNDRWGHQAGDHVLLEFSQRLSSAVRGQDTICRWGGDEFLAILPDCGLVKANERATQIRSQFNKEYTFKADGSWIKVMILASVGVAEWKRGETADSIFRRADEQLYLAKARRIA
ncbi:GGDEF domain-containing protein [Paludibaculum fermentans]|uniref:diguanylate cyclase n=1 Tax=Paludibaculum fermentans TaxID=1473598 RepID=A0A7S7NRC5_PALFE|nr:GGDEF domain-containing protein [Paludibaculum fermentans]QOY88309.1 GGDEF domain-containing protein [Paludibaculum fermentans]